MLVFRREDDWLLSVLTRAAYPVTGIKESNEKHKSDEHHRTGSLEVLQEFGADRAAPDCFVQRQCNMATIQNRERQHIEHGKVDVDDYAPPENQTPGIFTFEQVGVKPDDHDRTAQLLDANLSFVRKKSPDRRDDLSGALLNLLEGARMD